MRNFKSKTKGEGQRFPDKMQTLVDKTIIVDEVEFGENDWGEMALITYRIEEEDEPRKTQTNSEVLLKQLHEDIGIEDLPVRVKVSEVQSGKNKRYTYYQFTDAE